MISRLRRPLLLCAVLLVVPACKVQEPPKPAFSGNIAKGNPPAAAEAAAGKGAAPEASALSDQQSGELQAALDKNGAGCDVLDTSQCLLPFPSDAYLVDDPTTGTEQRVNLPTGQLANAAGATLDPTEWNRNDGFSPSTPILVHVPGLDPNRTKLPSEADIAASLEPDSATVVVDLDTGQLVPHWAEVDLRATSDADRLLIIRPAASLIETHRFAVGLRRMVGTNGALIPSPVAFQVFRDNLTTSDPGLKERRADFETVFDKMATAGVNRSDLYLAWYFTVASQKTLAGRVLAMRDDAFGTLAGGSPKFTVDKVERTGLRSGIDRVVDGTFQVPLYLDNGGAPGSRMVFDPATGDPKDVGRFTARYQCVVPTSAVTKGEARPVVYGHGLLGSASEVSSSSVQQTAKVTGSVYCATNWIGLADEDVPFVAQVLGDLNLFPSVPDRLQQSMLNTLFLGRLMLHEKGLGSAKAFQTSSGATVLNTETAYYDGNSQGAIMGGAVTAIAQDWKKASLGVPGMNYSTLLNRSTDFDQYFAVLRAAYPNPLEQQIAFGMMQMLWDRGEVSGYVQHLTDRTYDLTPAKEVLLSVAFGDHQVAPVTALNMARTLKIPVFAPELPKGVDPYLPTPGERNVPAKDVDPFFKLDPIRKFPFDGSALFMWYSGTLAPPLGNITPTMSDQWKAECQGAAAGSPKCSDPHEDPRRQPQVNAQKDKFFQPDGVVTNVCGETACRALPADKFDY